MKQACSLFRFSAAALALAGALSLPAQSPGNQPPGGPPPFGPGGPGGMGGPPTQEEIKLLGQFDSNGDKWLDWSKLGPMAEKNFALIAESVKIDTRKLDSTEAFLGSLKDDSASNNAQPSFGPGGPSSSIKSFADQRRAYLLSYNESASTEKK